MGIPPPDRTKTKVAGFFDGGLYYVRVRGISKAPYRGPVHNFRTSTGEYVVGGLLVHNCFGHWHKDQGVVRIDGRYFINQGAVSRGALIKENLERKPQVVLIEVTNEGVTVGTIPLKVAPVAEVFNLERKDRRDRESEVISQFAERLQKEIADAPTGNIDTSVQGLDFAPEVRACALEYLERARG